MKISVILPVKNQTKKLMKNLTESIIPYFDGCGVDYDVLICSDASNEEQQSSLVSLLAELNNKKVVLLPYSDTKGKGWAVKKSIEATPEDSDYVLFMDADLSTDLKAFDEIKPLLGQYDCFSASRHSKQSVITEKQTLVRRITSWGSRTIIKNKFHLKGLTDTQCGYKAFRTKIAKEMVKHQIIPGFAFDVEYIYFCFLNGFKIKEIPVRWQNDPDSTVSPLKASWTFYKDLRKIKKNRQNYILDEETKKRLTNAD